MISNDMLGKAVILSNYHSMWSYVAGGRIATYKLVSLKVNANKLVSYLMHEMKSGPFVHRLWEQLNCGLRRFY
jgi:hypothetical protein